MSLSDLVKDLDKVINVFKNKNEYMLAKDVGYLTGLTVTGVRQRLDYLCELNQFKLKVVNDLHYYKMREVDL